ncbi:MAG: DUF116 domain-containing protein [Deltaproteobacteria bacterium]|nr:DUF116 domain-containing protein [Deltaproteobacteria bacterium]
MFDPEAAASASAGRAAASSQAPWHKPGPSPAGDLWRFYLLSGLAAGLLPAALFAGRGVCAVLGAGLALPGWVVAAVTAVSGLVGLCLAVLWAAVKGPSSAMLFRAASMALGALYPVCLFAGRFVGLDKKAVRRAFIAKNNRVVAAQARPLPPSRVLLLLPHCLQSHQCAVRITMAPNNCQRCGKCSMAALLSLAGRRRIPLAVATGGTLARRFVAAHRPRLVVAVACERDLWSGIRDSAPLPVYGVLNQRPNGPCFDTHVDVSSLERALDRFAAGPLAKEGVL